MLKNKSEECQVGYIDKYLTFPSEYPWTSENIELWKEKGCHLFDKIAEEVFDFAFKKLNVPCIVVVRLLLSFTAVAATFTTGAVHTHIICNTLIDIQYFEHTNTTHTTITTRLVGTTSLNTTL
jgi:hypothetical protein